MNLKSAGRIAASGVLLVSLFFVLAGCSKNDSPVQSQANKQPGYQFTNIPPYTGMTIGEVSESIALGPGQAERLHQLVSELSAALIRDYESDDEAYFGVERYNPFVGRINPALTSSQQDAFGKLVAYHVDGIHFGKDLRFFLRRMARWLQLTPEQVEQVKECAKTYAEGAREVHKKVKEGNLTREQARQEIHGLFEVFVDCFKGKLTAEQLEKFKRFMQHERGH